MVTTEPASGIVVRVPVPPAIARLRRRWDRTAGMGVPAHVTILFPFLAPGRLTVADRRAVADVARGEPPFDVRFARVGRFPGVVYLVPEPAEPFIRLTTAIVGRFPDCPPYGGAFDGIVPHLTVAEADAPDLDAIAAQAAVSLPFERRVSTLEVIVEGDDGRWRPRWRIPLGVRR